MFGWEVVEVEAGEGGDDGNGRAVEEPAPLRRSDGRDSICRYWELTYSFSVLDGEPTGHGADDDGEVNADI